MSPEEARSVAKAAVQETFLALGVDISTPMGVLRMQHNFAFLDRLRSNVGKVAFYAITVLVLCAVTWSAYRLGFNPNEAAPEPAHASTSKK